MNMDLPDKWKHRVEEYEGVAARLDALLARAEKAENQVAIERECRLKNEAELVRADAEIGAWKKGVIDANRISQEFSEREYQTRMRLAEYLIPLYDAVVAYFEHANSHGLNGCDDYRIALNEEIEKAGKYIDTIR